METLPMVGLTAPALLLLAVWLVLTGRIVPRKTYEDAIRDRDDWRAAHVTSEAARLQQAKQIDELLEVGQTVEAIMRSIPHPSDRGA